MKWLTKKLGTNKTDALFYQDKGFESYKLRHGEDLAKLQLVTVEHMEIRKQIERRFNRYLAMADNCFKPIFTCPPCMSSVWGTAIYFYMINNEPELLNEFNLIRYLIILGCSVGLNKWLGK